MPPSPKNARILFVFLAIGLVGCNFRLPGAMGPTQTPEEIRRAEGEAGMYRLEKKAPQPPKTTGTAPAPKGPPASAVASRGPQAANPPARGRNEANPTPAATRYGDLFFISGQLPTDVRGNPTAMPQVEEHARLAMENVRAVLEANQMTMANVISTTVYLRDLNDIASFDRIYSTYFSGSPPSRSIVEVARLPDNAKVAISAVAGR